jgi:hypothetical protein
LYGAIRSRRDAGKRLSACLLYIKGFTGVVLRVGIQARNAPFSLFCRIEFKLDTPNGLSVLVHLLDLLIKRGLEVEAQGNAGVVISALQIEHLQFVIGVAGKGISFPSTLFAAPSRSTK